VDWRVSVGLSLGFDLGIRYQPLFGVMAQARLIVEHSTAALSGSIADAIFFLQIDDVAFPDPHCRDKVDQRLEGS
jgi:hypothetical protein